MAQKEEKIDFLRPVVFAGPALPPAMADEREEAAAKKTVAEMDAEAEKKLVDKLTALKIAQREEVEKQQQQQQKEASPTSSAGKPPMNRAARRHSERLVKMDIRNAVGEALDPRTYVIRNITAWIGTLPRDKALYARFGQYTKKDRTVFDITVDGKKPWILRVLTRCKRTGFDESTVAYEMDPTSPRIMPGKAGALQLVLPHGHGESQVCAPDMYVNEMEDMVRVLKYWILALPYAAGTEQIKTPKANDGWMTKACEHVRTVFDDLLAKSSWWEHKKFDAINGFVRGDCFSFYAYDDEEKKSGMKGVFLIDLEVREKKDGKKMYHVRYYAFSHLSNAGDTLNKSTQEAVATIPALVGAFIKWASPFFPVDPKFYALNKAWEEEKKKEKKQQKKTEAETVAAVVAVAPPSDKEKETTVVHYPAAVLEAVERKQAQTKTAASKPLTLCEQVDEAVRKYGPLAMSPMITTENNVTRAVTFHKPPGPAPVPAVPAPAPAPAPAPSAPVSPPAPPGPLPYVYTSGTLGVPWVENNTVRLIDWHEAAEIGLKELRARGVSEPETAPSAPAGQ